MRNSLAITLLALLFLVSAAVLVNWSNGEDDALIVPDPEQSAATKLDESDGSTAVDTASESRDGASDSERSTIPGPALVDEAARVLCRLVDGTPLPDAVVQVWSEGALLAESIAGADGIAPITGGFDSLAPYSVIGSAAGHALASGGPLVDADRAYELVFEPVDSVRVVVCDHRGDPVPEARVAYWPTHSRFDSKTLSDSNSADPLAGGFARTDTDGAFTVPRRRFEAGLHAIAVTDGVTSREPSRLGVGDECVVTVRPAYVAYLRWTTPDFGRPLVDPELYGSHGWGPRELESFRAGDLPEDGLALKLLGIDPEPRTAGVAGDGFDTWISYFGEERTDGFSGVEFRVSLPGYVEWTGEVFLYPIDPEPEVQEISLRSAGADFGIVDVDIGPELPRLLRQADPPNGRSVAWLYFHPTEGGRSIFYRVTTPVRQRFEIRGVPFGTYRAYLEISHTGWHSEASEIGVGPERAELILDYELLSALHLVPRTGAGDPYRRELGVALAWDGGEDIARLEGPPYLVLGLEPGRVRVSLRKAFDRLWSETETPLGEAEIVAGQRTWLEVRLPAEDAR